MCSSLRLKVCCCCCSVRTGTLVIAIVGWVLTLSKLFGPAGIPSNQQPVQNTRFSFDDEELSDNDNHNVNDVMNSYKENTFAVRIAYSVIALIACGLLIWGIQKKNHKFFLPWLILNAIESSLFSILCVICFVLIFVFPSPANVTFIVLFIMLLIGSFFCWYFWICVWSYYMDLAEATSAPNVHYNPNTGTPGYNKGEPMLA